MSMESTRVDNKWGGKGDCICFKTAAEQLKLRHPWRRDLIACDILASEHLIEITTSYSVPMNLQLEMYKSRIPSQQNIKINIKYSTYKQVSLIPCHASS